MDSQSDSQRINRITYLASLVSEPGSVDIMLDRLRVITATSTQLSSHDHEKLESIQRELEDYLIHKERLRSFTKESLQTNVERHFATENPVQKAKRAALKQIMTSVVISSVITSLLVILQVIQGQVIIAFLIFALFVGLAIIYQSFKKDLVIQLRGSLNYLMVAIVGNGIFALNFPIIAASSYLESHPMLQHGGFLIGAVPVYAFYYGAFYLYAKQLKVSIPRLLKPRGAILTAVVIAIVASLVPHPVAVPHEIYFDLAVVGFAVSVYLSGISAVLGFMAISKTTAIYSKSSRFLAISILLQTIGNANFLILVTFVSGAFSVNEQKGQILTGLFIIAALITQYIAAYKSKTSLYR